MLVGDALPGTLFGEWRFVDGDLYGVAGRVREYDEDARLIVSPDGRLGIARRIPVYRTFTGGEWVLARWCRDPDTGGDLVGEPDARVVEDMRRADAHRVRSLRAYYARMWDAGEEADRRRLQARVEEEMPVAERAVWAAHRKDLGHMDTISVPVGV